MKCGAGGGWKDHMDWFVKNEQLLQVHEIKTKEGQLDWSHLM